MITLEILLGFKSKQGDVTCAFIHADLEPGENVYVDMPLGFAQYSKNGMYGHEEHMDPDYAKNWTGFIIAFANHPVLWQSKLKTETALSTMEANIIAPHAAESCFL
jgi:hypothetical protein